MLYSKTSYFFVFFPILLLTACGGTKSTLRKAEQSFLKGEYAIAGDLYNKAYSRISSKDKPLRAETAFRQGECYRLTNYSRAEQIYMNAVRNKYPDSIAYLRLAQMQQKNGKLREAAANYEICLKAMPDNELAMNGLQAVNMIDSLKNNPTRYIISRDKNFNAARSSSFSPAFSGTDASVLIFTSNRKVNKKDNSQKKNTVSGQPNNHLFAVKKNSQGIWGKPEILEGEVTTKNDEGIASFTADGNTLYFSRSLTEENKGEGVMVFVSTSSGGSWGAPQSITLFNDSSISTAHPAIDPDGKMLYFVSDAPGGYGGKDLWRARLEAGKVEFVENLGSEINTSGDEMFPTFKPDGTLYYSSSGKPGVGGLDIFKAVLIHKADSTQAWKVTNMGIPLNSSADDFGMAFFGDSETGFFSSNRNETRGYDALWSFVLPELEYVLEGKITARNGSSIPDARINIVGSDGESIRMNAKGDGSYRFRLKKDVSYQLQASANEFLNQRDSISTFSVNPRESQTFTRNFSLTPTFQSVKIDNIYYDFDKATLRPESREGLDALIAMMNENPNITIEMSAHTDYKGNSDYNRDLSARRAQSVIDYLIGAGIDAARLTAVGYGEVKPFVVDTVTAQQYTFLTQGTPLSEQYILSLPDEQQETCNQINRRTEFKILSTTYNMY